MVTLCVNRMEMRAEWALVKYLYFTPNPLNNNQKTVSYFMRMDAIKSLLYRFFPKAIKANCSQEHTLDLLIQVDVEMSTDLNLSKFKHLAQWNLEKIIK